jgi:hypothetical protein
VSEGVDEELAWAVLNTVAFLKSEIDKCEGNYEVRVNPMTGGWWIEVTRHAGVQSRPDD